jgi:hypothetical protein
VAECGTYAGDQQHRKRGERSCPDCLAAKAEYTRTLRAWQPETRAKDRAQNRAWSRADARLRAAHAEEFARYLREEKGK